MEDVSLDVLQITALFAGLEDEQIQTVKALGTRHRFHKHDTIMHSGEMGNNFCIVLAGQVEIIRQMPEESPPLVILGAGQCFGEIAVLDAGPRTASVRCASATAEILAIQGEALLQLCRRDRHLGYQLMYNLARDLAYKLRQRNFPPPPPQEASS